MIHFNLNKRVAHFTQIKWSYSCS